MEEAPAGQMERGSRKEVGRARWAGRGARREGTRTPSSAPHWHAGRGGRRAGRVRAFAHVDACLERLAGRRRRVGKARRGTGLRGLGAPPAGILCLERGAGRTVKSWRGCCPSGFWGPPFYPTQLTPGEGRGLQGQNQEGPRPHLGLLGGALGTLAESGHPPKHPQSGVSGRETMADGGPAPPTPASLPPSLRSSISRLYLNVSFVQARGWAHPSEAVSRATTIGGFRAVNQRCHGNPILSLPRCGEGRGGDGGGGSGAPSPQLPSPAEPMGPIWLPASQPASPAGLGKAQPVPVSPGGP